IGADPGPQQPIFVGGNVGRYSGGEGTLVIDDSDFVIQGSSAVGAFMHVGREGGTGSVVVTNEGSLGIAGSGAILVVGREAGSEGSLLVDGGDVSLHAYADNATVMIGRDGGNGTMTLQNGSTLDISGGF